MKKTICILPQKIGRGGPGSFHSRIAAVLTSRGYTFNHDPLDPANSVILVIGGTRHIGMLREAKRNGVRIVQRLNGMNWVHRQKRTGIKHFLRAEVNNWILKTIRGMADQIVYQSKFTQGWWSRTCGETKHPGRVIYNGVNLDVFNPIGAGLPPTDRTRILLVEANLGGGYEGGLDSAVQMAKLLSKRQTTPVELMVVGSVPPDLQINYLGCGVDIVWKGLVKREAIPAIDRSAHLFFSSDINAACPNSVIEALACGLPVIGYDTGSLAELVSSDCGSVARYGSDPWKLQKPDIHALVDAAQQALNNQSQKRAAARARAEKFYNIERIVDQYLEVMLDL
ncbi:glycosyltransferase family 1 protein [bacterium]|nr:glycosyltransferase family 1 protein [bacterium]